MAPGSSSAPAPEAGGPHHGGAPPQPEAGAARPGVVVAELVAGYGRRPAVLHGVGFTCAPGEITAVVGPNGAGKTTLFRVLLGFLRPRTGRVELEGLEPVAFRRRRGVGFLPDAVAFPRGWTGMACLREGVRLAGIGGRDVPGALESAIRRTGLTRDELGRTPGALSKGMARRVALGVILAGSPRILLLDEPLTGLDAESRVRLREEILGAAAAGAAVVLASHELREVERMADRVVLLRGGRVERLLEGVAVRSAPLEEMILGRPAPEEDPC